MKIFPAIDLRDGKCVRLYQGDYDQMTVYQYAPEDTAARFYEAGARYLHMVDLDGAKDGTIANFETVRKVTKSVDMFVEIGGGIRDEERIKRYLDAGAWRVILGTIAARDPEFVGEMAQKYPGQIAVGVDARDGMVAVNGWKETTSLSGIEFCEQMADIGVASIIYTDISRDGAMQGTNIEVYRQLSKIDGIEVTASGGISSIEEIRELASITHAAILGKALYDGVLDLAECIAVANNK